MEGSIDTPFPLFFLFSQAFDNFFFQYVCLFFCIVGGGGGGGGGGVGYFRSFKSSDAL